MHTYKPYIAFKGHINTYFEKKKCTINKNGSEKEEKIVMMKEDLLHWVGLALDSDNKS